MSQVLRTVVHLTAILLLLSLGPGAKAFAQESEGGVTLNLRDAELSAVIDLISKMTGKTFIVDPRVRGKVTIVSQEPLAREDAYRVFLSILELNRFTVVENNGVSRIVPLQLAKELSNGGSTMPAGQRGFVTRAIKLNYADASRVVEMVRPLVPSEAVISAFPERSLLVISDYENNLEKVATLVRELDVDSASRVTTIPLRYASARATADTLTAMEIAGPGSRVSADVRTNALLVSGPPHFVAEVGEIVRRLDVPSTEIGVTVVQLNYANATELATTLAQLFTIPTGEDGAKKPASVVAEPKTNSLIISVPPEMLPSMRKAIASLDKRPPQVLIEAVVFEVSSSRFADLSVQFGGVIDAVFAGGAQFLMPGRSPLASVITSVLGGKIPDLGEGVSVGGQVSNGKFGVAGLLSALASDTGTNILSTPSIMTLDNEPAEIVVGRKVPFVTGRFSTVGESAVPNQPFQTILREDVGLSLKVKPMISKDDTVRLEIRQEVSNLTSSASAAGGEITERRAISTNVIVRSNYLLMLGGLIQEQSNQTKKKVPGLGDIPIFGRLARSDLASRDKRILLLLLRPTIIRNDKQLTKVTSEVYGAAARVEPSLAGDSSSWPNSYGLGLASIGRQLARPQPSDPIRQLPEPPPLIGSDRW